jgi:hypothetical protein
VGVLTLVAFWGSPLPSARAQDATPPPGNDPLSPNGPGRTINPDTGSRDRGIPSPGNGTSAMNNRAIALAGSIGSGESVVYYFDTELQRLLVYQYRGGDPRSERSGLRLVAARHIDYEPEARGVPRPVRAEPRRAPGRLREDDPRAVRGPRRGNAGQEG